MFSTLNCRFLVTLQLLEEACLHGYSMSTYVHGVHAYIYKYVFMYRHINTKGAGCGYINFRAPKILG